MFNQTSIVLFLVVAFGCNAVLADRVMFVSAMQECMLGPNNWTASCSIAIRNLSTLPQQVKVDMCVAKCFVDEIFVGFLYTKSNYGLIRPLR